MLSLKAKIRQTCGKKVKALRKKGVLPAVFYGPKLKSKSLEVDLKEFEKILAEAGESTLISLEIEGEKEKNLVLIHEIEQDHLSGQPLHVDFYQPSLKKEIEAKVPVVLEGEAPAVKNLGGTLIKNIAELIVKALPQNLPKEIRVNVGSLATFQDHILIKDLTLGEGVKIMKEPQEIVAHVAPLEKVEEELAKPMEEKVEDVEKVAKVEKEKKPAEAAEAGEEKAEAKPSSAKTPEGKEK